MFKETNLKSHERPKRIYPRIMFIVKCTMKIEFVFRDIDVNNTHVFRFDSDFRYL